MECTIAILIRPYVKYSSTTVRDCCSYLLIFTKLEVQKFSFAYNVNKLSYHQYRHNCFV